MRWVTPKKPMNGDARIIKKFAWLPVEIGTLTIWLEFYSIEQRFSKLDGWYPYKMNVIEKDSK